MVWYDIDVDGVLDASEGRSGVSVFISDVDGRAAFATTSDRRQLQPPGHRRPDLYPERERARVRVLLPDIRASGRVHTTQNIKLLAINRTVEGILTYLGAPPRESPYRSSRQDRRRWRQAQSPAQMAPTSCSYILACTTSSSTRTDVRLQRHQVSVLGALDGH